MGVGIAEALSLAGFEVVLVDVKRRGSDETSDALERARRDVAADLELLYAIGVGSPDASGPIHYRVLDDAEAAFASVEVVFEAVPESVEAKREALGLIERHTRPHAIVASTTSSFLPDELARALVRPQRFINTHWLNPAPLMPLVEVSAGLSTDEGTIERVITLLRQAGKVPVLCKASAGYIVPRIQALAMNEAARLVEEEVATAEEIDTATRLGIGVRFAVLGMLEFIDWGGADILCSASSYLERSLGNPRFATPAIVERQLAEGAVGVRSGTGFYELHDVDLAAYRRTTLEKLAGLLAHLGLLPIASGHPAAGPVRSGGGVSQL